MTAGGAGLWDPPAGYARIDVPDLIDVLRCFEGLNTVADYLSALEDEMLRRKIAVDIADDVSSDAEKLYGYRTYDWCYAYFGALRRGFKKPEEWSIYTGGHNPVLCWNPSWRSEELHDRNMCRFGKVYCEFNWGKFLLKLAWKGTRSSTAFYDAVDLASGRILGAGMVRTRRSSKPNLYTAFAKKQFDSLRDVGRIVSWVNGFLPDTFLDICQAIGKA